MRLKFDSRNSNLMFTVSMFCRRPFEFIYILPFMLFFTSCNQNNKYTDKIYTKPPIVANPELKSLTPEEALKKFFYRKVIR